MNLIGDFWERNRNKEYVIENVTENQAIENLKSLDGLIRTEIILEKPHESLIIAGGNEGLYIVNLGKDDDMSYVLTKEVKEDKEIKLVCGGQMGIFSSKNCFNLKDIEPIIKDFFGDRDILALYDWSIN